MLEVMAIVIIGFCAAIMVIGITADIIREVREHRAPKSDRKGA